MVLNASTPAEIPSPVVLSTLSVHRSTGLAFLGDVVVLCIMKGAIAPVPSPFPGAVYQAATN
jgi:hypothetical protein